MAIVRFHLQLQTTSLEVCKGFNLVKQNETNHVIRLCKRARLVKLAFIINFGHVIYVCLFENSHLTYTAIWPKRVCSVKFTRCWCIFGRSCQREQDVVNRFKIDLDTVSTVDVAKTCILISFSWFFPAEPNVGNNVEWVLFNSFLCTV